MALTLDVLSWLLLTAGGAAVLIGGVGALRMPDLYTRMHAASVTDSLGAILVIAGIMLQAGLTLATIKLGAILLFLLLTSPTSSYALASAALLAGRQPMAPVEPEAGSDATGSGSTVGEGAKR
jgi:multicomponent Na+:H+ antiporter subunit G